MKYCFGGDEFYIFTNNIKDEEDLRILLTTTVRTNCVQLRTG